MWKFHIWRGFGRGPKDHINMRISHSGSKDQYKGDTRNHDWWDPYVCVDFWGPIWFGMNSY